MTIDQLSLGLLAAISASPEDRGWLDTIRTGDLPFNWFDIAVVVFLAIGFTRGRKHGMSVEMLYLAQWIAMIVGAAFVYEPVGQFMAANTVFSLLFSYITVYIFAVIGIRIFFLVIKRTVGGKLVGSNLFGPAEYYLGMAAGILRFAGMVILFLALLNARYITSAEIKTTAAYNRKYYGGEMNSGTFFPDLHTIQTQVFEKSFLGPKIHDSLACLLIKPTESETREIKRKEADLPQ